MVPTYRVDDLDLGIDVLARFAQRTGVRGRFIALYLGLRLMGTAMSPLGGGGATPAREVEDFLDSMWTKTHREEPYVVLTAPFGGSTSPTAPYSCRSGVVAPGNSYPTNTWRNNFAIQKGVGCPADAETVRGILDSPDLRLSCPHMGVDPEGRNLCQIQNTAYRGEEHSVWLRMLNEGYQAVDLDARSVWVPYFKPDETPIPVFPLIAVIYSMAPSTMYRARERVGIPDLAEDFGFEVAQVRSMFDCDPDSRVNAEFLARVNDEPLLAPGGGPVQQEGVQGSFPEAGELPAAPTEGVLNTGVGAELMVAGDLALHGWEVRYRGNQQGIGYDLEAWHGGEVLRVEVKSSVGYTQPELLESEWEAALRYGQEYVVAIVDFYGSEDRGISYIRDPASNTTPVERVSRVFRLVREEVDPISTEAEFL